MSGIATTKLLRAYEDSRPPSMFFTSLAQSPPENFYDTEDIEIDVTRSGEDVAIVVAPRTTGPRENTTDLYTNKRFVAPMYDEAITVRAGDLLKRMAGQNPFAGVNTRAALVTRTFEGVRKVHEKIARAIELQAAQVFQTGVLDLKDSAGTTLYTLDYKPKSTHFATVPLAWSNASADIIGDISGICRVVTSDGKRRVNQIFFGSTAWTEALSNTAFRAQFEARRIDVGTVQPTAAPEGGAMFLGRLTIDTFILDMYLYDAEYTDPQTGIATRYLAEDKVVVRASEGRIDATFGAVPNIGRLIGQGQDLLPDLPTRMSLAGRAMDLNMAIGLTDLGRSLTVAVASRPLIIPTAIDTFGCLTT